MALIYHINFAERNQKMTDKKFYQKSNFWVNTAEIAAAVCGTLIFLWTIYVNLIKTVPHLR